MLTISLAIVNYNDNDFLKKLFSSLKEQSVKFDKIIFIDNCSVKDPMRMISSVKGLNIKYLRNSENMFFAPTNNIALRELVKEKSDIIGIINPDMYFEKDCFRTILNHFENNSGVAAIQPRLYKIGTDSLTSPPFKLSFKRFSSIEGDCTKETVTVSGAGFFVRREILLKSGLFYEPFFHYSEDSYLSYKVSKFGKLVWLYEAVGYHRVGLEVKNRKHVDNDLMPQLKARNDYVLSLKTFKDRPLWLIFDLIEFGKQCIFFAIGYKSRALRLNYIKGYLWGFSETFYHLFNNDKYLSRGIDTSVIPKGNNN